MKIQELEQLIQLCGNDIYTFCIRLTNSPQEADDLYQDTFLTAIEQLDKIDLAGNPKSYLLSISLRIWKNRKRKYAWRQRIAPATGNFNEANKIASQEPTIEEIIISEEEQGIIYRAVQQLEDKYRIPVILFYTELLPVKEIASLLKLPVGTVKSRLHYARKRLEKELEVFFP